MCECTSNLRRHCSGWARGRRACSTTPSQQPTCQDAALQRCRAAWQCCPSTHTMHRTHTACVSAQATCAGTAVGQEADVHAVLHQPSNPPAKLLLSSAAEQPGSAALPPTPCLGPTQHVPVHKQAVQALQWEGERQTCMQYYTNPATHLPRCRSPALQSSLAVLPLHPHHA